MKDSRYFDAGTVASFDRLAVPFQFLPPARDLVAMLKLHPGSLVFNVGAGTGAATIPAMAAVGSKGLVVGLDPSVEMLRRLQRKGACPVVVAKAPGLPFPDGLFDAALANFVLSHFNNHAGALADMVRMLRPGGQVGVTTWGVAPNPVAQLWKDVAAAFVSLDELQAAFREVIPWDEWFSQAANLRQALKDANLVSARITRCNYVVTMNVTDYLAVKETAVEGTLLRRSLMADQWTAFKQRVAAVFQDRFPDTVEYVRDVYFGIGMKRAA